MAEQAAFETVGVVGLGFLGRGIAACLLGSGLRVIGYARKQESHDQAATFITTAIDEMVQHGAVPAQVSTQWRERYTPCSSMEPLAACDFVIESVLEDLAVKESVFDGIESVVGAAVPIATNTSALPITVLQRGRRHPGRFIGMHWAEPCYVTRFMEVICGEQTSEATLQAALRLARLTRKEPAVLRRDVEGFIANRLGYAMYREAFHLLESGIADVETIDRSFRNAVGLFASMCGPFRWMDITGIPAYAAVMKRLLPDLCNDPNVPATIKTLVDSGAEGIRNRRGFYNYTDQEAQRWEKLLHEHAWHVRAWMDRHFPLSQT